MSNDNNVLKIVILGEGRVGKTSILSQYFKNNFNEGEETTINPSFYEKTINYKGKNIQLKFWDTVGQEQFNAITTIYYQNSVGAILVYDVTIFETFKKVEKWVNTLKEVVGDIAFVIAGNKFDLFDKRLVGQYASEIEAYCAKEKCQHFYTSAKTRYNLDEIFNSLINRVLSKINLTKSDDVVNKRKGRKLEIIEENKKKKEGCC